MKLFSGFRYAAMFAFFLLLAAPAFAQFEVSPDHFDSPPPAKPKIKAASKKKAGVTANSSSQIAGRKNAARKAGAPSVGANSVKPHPGRKAGNNSALATKNNGAAPNLKAQASVAHRE